MNCKIKNMLIDGLFPLVFWGTVYLLAVGVNYWTWPQYTSWYFLMVILSPLNIIGGRAVNTWRRLFKYEYKGYQ